MTKIDLNLLPIAIALYDEGSVSRAAQLLGMSQPGSEHGTAQAARRLSRSAVRCARVRHHANAQGPLAHRVRALS